MSVRVDTTPWIAGSVIVGDTGGGILAENVPSSGTNGPGLGYEHLSFPADNGKEYRVLVTSFPSGATVDDVAENGEVDLVVPADGVYTYVYDLYLDYVYQSTHERRYLIGDVAVAEIHHSDAAASGTVVGAGVTGTADADVHHVTVSGTGAVAISGTADANVHHVSTLAFDVAPPEVATKGGGVSSERAMRKLERDQLLAQIRRDDEEALMFITTILRRRR